MTKSIKALGLLLTALLTMGAALASVAQAAESFHSHVGEKNPHNVILTGEQVAGGKLVLRVKSASIQCTESTYRGTQAAGETHTGTLGTTVTLEAVTVHPTYSGCELGGHALTVNTHKCHYKLFAATPGAGMGNVEILSCPSTEPIEIIDPTLKVTTKIANQTLNEADSYESNKTGGTQEWDVKAKVTTGEQLAYTCTPALACNLGGLGTSGTTAEVTGEVTFKGYEDLEATETGTYNEGSQLGIWHGPTV